MIADAYQHDIDLVVIGDVRDVGKKSGVAGVINGWAIANGDDQSGWGPRVNRRRFSSFCTRRSVPCRDKTNIHIPADADLRCPPKMSSRVAIPPVSPA